MQKNKGKLLVGALFLAACAGLFYFYAARTDSPAADERTTAEKDAQPQEGPVTLFNLNSTENLFTGTEITDFLYEEEPAVEIVETEEFNPQKLEASLNKPDERQDQIAELIAREIKFDMQPHEDFFAGTLEARSEDILDRLYEEELPDDILDVNPDNPDEHLYRKKASELKIIPSSKPFYFGETPVIAIVIDDMGVSPKRTHDIATINAPLTASFLTYSRNLPEQIANSAAAGHEIMIHVPMEAQSDLDAAPDVLTTTMSLREIQTNLQKMLDKFSGIKGINNHMGSKLTEDYERMTAVMEVLAANRLFFLDSKTSAKSRAEEAAKATRIPYAHRHVFLDNNNDKAYILGQLGKTEKLARKNGYAIAIGHPKTQTFAALQEWLPSLKDKHIRLVHLSEIVAILNPGREFAALLPRPTEVKQIVPATQTAKVEK